MVGNKLVLKILVFEYSTCRTNNLIVISGQNSETVRMEEAAQEEKIEKNEEKVEEKEELSEEPIIVPPIELFRNGKFTIHCSIRSMLSIPKPGGGDYLFTGGRKGYLSCWNVEKTADSFNLTQLKNFSAPSSAKIDYIRNFQCSVFEQIVLLPEGCVFWDEAHPIEGTRHLMCYSVRRRNMYKGNAVMIINVYPDGKLKLNVGATIDSSTVRFFHFNFPSRLGQR